MNAARRGIPVRFDPDAASEVEIKISGRNVILQLGPPVLPEFHLSVRGSGRERLKALLAPFNRSHAMASVTLLDELHLDKGRLEAVLKNGRKKRY